MTLQQKKQKKWRKMQLQRHTKVIEPRSLACSDALTKIAILRKEYASDDSNRAKCLLRYLDRVEKQIHDLHPIMFIDDIISKVYNRFAKWTVKGYHEAVAFRSFNMKQASTERYYACGVSHVCKHHKCLHGEECKWRREFIDTIYKYFDIPISELISRDLKLMWKIRYGD